MRSGALATDEGAERGGSGVLHEAARGIVERFRKECGRACLVIWCVLCAVRLRCCRVSMERGMELWRRRVGASGSRALGALCTAERKRGDLAAWRSQRSGLCRPTVGVAVGCGTRRLRAATLNPYRTSTLSLNSVDGGRSGEGGSAAM